MTTPYYQDESVTLHHGDCLDVLRTLPDGSVHAVVTDPPYGLEFMGKEWDGADGFRRSLNPADAGRESVFGRTSRTSPEYRTASKAKAGMTGTGYTDGANRMDQPSFLGGLNPKCLSCGRWQRGGNPCTCDTPEFTNERLPRLHSFQEWCEAWARECLRVLKPGGHMLAFGGSRTWHRLAAAVEDAGFEIRDSIAWLYGSGFPKSRNLDGDWQGWGTALKPAFEPIVVARKPLAGTVAGNVLAHGTGALNIDASRVGDGSDSQGARPLHEGSAVARYTGQGGTNFAATPGPRGGSPDGRWPTNVLLDDTQADELDRQAPATGSWSPNGAKYAGSPDTDSHIGGLNEQSSAHYGDMGGASRFFPTFRYEAKAPTEERPRVDGIAHPTVKPLDLMRWLVRLVTPPGGTVLDPFAGSGTTAEACVIEGFQCIAIEREPDYLPLIKARLTKPLEPVLDLGGIA